MITKFFSILLLNLYLYEFNVKAQGIDTNFCNIATIAPDDGQNIPLPSQNIQKYQANTEINRDYEKVTEEVIEYYDSVDNLGISINFVAGKEIRTYSYYDTDELLLIAGEQCIVKKLSESYELSPFFVVNVNGQEHIISGLGYLLLPIANTTFAYLGSMNRVVRNIPVREWQTCLFSKKDNSTLKLTISYSDPEKWAMQTANLSVPIQFKVETKKPDGTGFVEYHTITEYRPDLLIQEEDFSIPSGLYCPGRKNTKPLPAIPSAFRYITHKALSGLGTDSLSGSLEVLRIEQDYDKKLHRYDYLKGADRMTEIHDYDSGLGYTINNSENSCTITALDLNNNTEAQRPAEFFTFDLDPPFQYIGQKRARGVNCDVWVAPRVYQNITTIYEWYFMATGWIVQESTAVKNNEPVQLKITFKFPTPQITLKLPLYFQIFNFDQTTIDLFDFDVGRCTSLPRQTLKFDFTNSYFSSIKANQLAFKEGLVNSIQTNAQINLLRISQLKLTFGNKTVSTIFSLIEKSNLAVNPNAKPNVPSAVAIENLKNSIKSGFGVAYKDMSLDQTVSVVADVNSFYILGSGFSSQQERFQLN